MNFTPFRPGELAAHGIDPYDSPARRRRIVFAVLAVHVLIIAVPLIWIEISRLLDPPKIVMKVALVDLPEGNSLDVPKDQTGKPETPAAEPEPPAPEPPAPEPPAPEPPTPKVETPPKVEPLPKVEQPPKPPVKEPPKVKPPPEVKPKKIEPPKVEPKKVEPKKVEQPPKEEPKKPKYLRPEDIQKTGRRVKTNNPDPKAEARRKAAEQARADAERRAAETRRQVAADARNAGYGSIAGGEKGIPATEEYYKYIDELKKIVEQRWTQPNSVELEGKRPEAKLTLSIRKDGSVEKLEFARTGIAAMDKSLLDLQSRLKAVPPPPQAMTVDVTLRVK